VLDSQTALKIFLEYYIREKKVRAFIIRKMFEEEPRLTQSVKSGISFFSFKKILTQFDPDITDIEVATLYRDAWTSGNGSVNFDSFFLVANEKTFFLKTLRVLGFNVAPVLNAYEDIHEDNRYH
jgi:hypothetical protein